MRRGHADSSGMREGIHVGGAGFVLLGHGVGMNFSTFRPLTNFWNPSVYKHHHGADGHVLHVFALLHVFRASSAFGGVD